jgi:transposase
MIYVGIDVGKDSLVIARQVLSDAQLPKAFSIEKVANTLDAINAWLSKTDLKDTQIILEATGTYSYRLAYCLDLSEIAYSILSPKQSRGFAQSMKIVSQNDERDAILLSLYGKLFTPSVDHQTDGQLHQLRQKRKHLSSLLSQRQAITNQLHALSFDPRVDPKVQDSLQMLQTTLDIQIEAFEGELYNLDDQEYQKIYQQLIQIKGIGPASASTLIVATNGFHNFTCVKKVFKFVGTIPSSKDSGTSVRIKGQIIKTGIPHLRAILYNAAKSARRYNNACKELYERLRKNGKAHKVAMVAVINKLIKQAFAIVKNESVFDNNYASAK